MNVATKKPCVGCNEVATPAAFAIMRASDAPKGRKPDVQGAGAFVAFAVCAECHENPAHRKRTLKAHFALPQDVERMVGAAGSSGKIG